MRGGGHLPEWICASQEPRSLASGVLVEACFGLVELAPDPVERNSFATAVSEGNVLDAPAAFA